MFSYPSFCSIITELVNTTKDVYNKSFTPIDMLLLCFSNPEKVMKDTMALIMSIATSTQPASMCACGYGHYIVKISHFAKNPSRVYYQCPYGVVSTNTLNVYFSFKTITNTFFTSAMCQLDWVV